MDTTREVGNFIVDRDFRNLPEAGLATAKQAFIGCIDVTLAGSADIQKNSYLTPTS